jgi:hypothetical protein
MAMFESDFKKYISTFLEFLNQKNIQSVDDIINLKESGQVIPVEKQGYIEIGESPSEGNTSANIVSYVIPGKQKEQKPIEILINKDKRYSSIFLKCNKKLEKYKVLVDSQTEKSILQVKRFQGTDFSKIKSELENLLELS